MSFTVLSDDGDIVCTSFPEFDSAADMAIECSRDKPDTEFQVVETFSGAVYARYRCGECVEGGIPDEDDEEDEDYDEYDAADMEYDLRVEEMMG